MTPQHTPQDIQSERPYDSEWLGALKRGQREGYLRAKTEDAPLLEAAKAVADNLDDAQGAWAAVTETYSPEWTWPLKEGAEQLRAAILIVEAPA